MCKDFITARALYEANWGLITPWGRI
jgi:hypothetical protein